MHSNKTLLHTSLILSLNLLFSSTGQADIDELYHLSVGTNVSFFDTDISISGINGAIGSGIDLEDDLNYDKQVNTAWLSGWYRVGDNHRLQLTYLPIKRSSFLESTRDITFNNATIKAGAFISSDTRSEIIDVSYIYSLHRSAQLDIGFSAGIYWLLNDTKITAAGEIQSEGENQSVFRANYFSQQKLQAPMPLLGFKVDYKFSDNWRTHASFRYLNLQINEAGGKILTANIATEYYFNKNWGLGTSISTFSLDANYLNIISTASLKWSYSAAQVYAVFKY